MARSIRTGGLKQTLLNGERLVADDITSHHYPAIDRKIPTGESGQWSGVCHLSSDACNDAIQL